MSDDIVTRLREKGNCQVPMTSGVTFKARFPIMLEAANEIEHLHKLLNNAEIERELWRERCERAEECLDWIYRTKRRWRLW